MLRPAVGVQGLVVVVALEGEEDPRVVPRPGDLVIAAAGLIGADTLGELEDDALELLLPPDFARSSDVTAIIPFSSTESSRAVRSGARNPIPPEPGWGPPGAMLLPGPRALG